MPYRTFFMVACSDGEAEDWVRFLRWRLVSGVPLVVELFQQYYMMY